MGLHSMMATQCAVSTVSPRSDAGLPRDSPANGFRKEQLNITGSVWIPRHHELKYGAPGPCHPITPRKNERWQLKKRRPLETISCRAISKRKVTVFVDDYNHCRCHESIYNFMLADSTWGGAISQRRAGVCPQARRDKSRQFPTR